MPLEPEVEAFRQHWVDCLAAFGAWIEIEVLPDHIEHRTRGEWLGDPSGVGERPVRIRVVNRRFVTGVVLKELDEQRSRIVAAFMQSDLNHGDEDRMEPEEIQEVA